MTIHLSKRLARIASFVEPEARIADIGTDHAYIPIALAEAGTIDFAVASDIGEGPCAIARTNIANANLSDKIVVRQADGLTGLREEDGLDTIIIAGMGGQLMVDILEAGMRYLDGTESLILEPNRDDYTVRAWLAANEFGILDEDLIDDDGHVYPIIVAGQTRPEVPYTQADMILGPVLRKQRSALFLSELDRAIHTTEQVIAGLKQASTTPSAKLEEATARLALLQKEAANA